MESMVMYFMSVYGKNLIDILWGLRQKKALTDEVRLLPQSGRPQEAPWKGAFTDSLI